MMKLKKIIAAAASVVMACVFATSAFAAAPYDAMRDKAAAKYPEYADVIKDLTDTQVQQIKGTSTFDEVVARVDSVQNQIKADPANAQATVNAAIAGVSGISVSDVKVTTNADGSVVVSAKVSNTATGKAFSVSRAVVAAYDAHPEIGEAIKNGTWGVDEKKATTAAAVTSAAAGKGVIKATGDNAAVVLVMGALAIVGVLGLAVRKNGAEA